MTGQEDPHLLDRAWLEIVFIDQGEQRGDGGLHSASRRPALEGELLELPTLAQAIGQPPRVTPI